MSKAIRWQVPFASISGTKYRVDIYDEQDGSWSGVTQLLGGTSPFTTDEDDSDDYFAPIRTQSGTIEVCTLMPDGNYITLDDLLPANNIARPVRLINLDNSNAIEWQGFLSCEAYSQDYTGIPQILDLPLISVLEAMASVQLDISLAGIMTIRQLIYNILEEMSAAIGIGNEKCFDYIYTSITSYGVLAKYTPTTQFFSDKVIDSWTKRTHVINYVDCKKIMERICVFMGWVVRENGRSLFFQYLPEGYGMKREAYTTYNTGSSAEDIDISQQGLSTLDWLGTDHKRSVSMGAKSVEVVAKLGQISFGLDNPDFNEYALAMVKSYLYAGTSAQGTSPSGDRAFEHGQIFNNNIDELAKCYVYVATQQYVYAGGGASGYRFQISVVEQQTAGNIISQSIACGANYTLDLNNTVKTIGAFYMRGIKWDITQDQPDNYNEGVYISGLPANSLIQNWYNIFRMKSAIPIFSSGGQIKINMEGFGLARNRYIPVTTESGTYYNGVERFGTILEETTFEIYCKLKLGNKYYNGSSWVTSESVFRIQFTDGKAETDIALSSGLTGYVEFYVVQGCPTQRYLSYTSDGRNWEDRYYQIEDYFFSSISVKYDPGDPEYGVRDVDENHYLMNLHIYFRDEIKIETDIASDLNNKQSISFLYDDANCTKRMQTIQYRGLKERPEENLLNRLKRHYGIPRACLNLIASHPDTPLPLSQFAGINEERQYLILSENRDWRSDECTLKCFDTYNAIPIVPPGPEPIGGEIDLTEPTYTFNGFRMDIENGEIVDVMQGVTGAKLYIKEIIAESAGVINLHSNESNSGIFLYYDYDIAELILALETNDTEWLNDNISHLVGGASGASGTASLNVTASNYVLLYQGTVTAEFEESQ